MKAVSSETPSTFSEEVERNEFTDLPEKDVNILSVGYVKGRNPVRDSDSDSEDEYNFNNDDEGIDAKVDDTPVGKSGRSDAVMRHIFCEYFACVCIIVINSWALF